MGCTDVEQAVENQDGGSAVSLVEGDRSDAPVGPYNRIRLPDRVRTARRFGGTGLRLLELADDGETDRKAASGKRRGQDGEAVKVVERLAFEHGQNPFERLDGRTEFAAGLSGACYVHLRRELQPLVAAGQAQGPLARRQRLCGARLQDKTIGSKGMYPAEPGAVLELCGNLFGRFEAIKRFLDAPQRRQGMPQVDAQIDRQRGPLVGRQMLDGNKRPFEML